ncbi:MAG TPA: 2-amino-4-hydroxy-6-hydroxymethyldihydropteridine diphosphokinase [Puia sp.]|jgi:2-amino-4-hydroxy-6-hydroxymethyldihydropteridine diphosphokinase
MNISYLLIGGNQGERTAQLALAREKIAARTGRLLRVSSLYETAAWGKTDQASFLNQALKLETRLEASVLIDVVLNIEQQMGRQRLERYGSRIIDIDILFFNDTILRLPNLVIPHPEIQNRRFVLTPMAEIAPLLIHPILGLNIEQLLEACPDPLAVQRLKINE